MKPVLGMEGEKPAVIRFTGDMDKTTTEPQTKSSMRKIIIGVIVGLVALAVVATIVILSVHFGAKITSDNYKEAKQIFKMEDGKVTEEETTVTENEVDIKVPNEVEIIYDYKHGIVVQRFVDPETKTKSDCYARYLNQTQAPTRDAERYEEDGEVDLQSAGQEEEYKEEKWEVTSKRVSRHLISKNVERMCNGADIYWMEKTAVEESGMSKRGAIYLGYKYVCFKESSWRCLYRCYKYYKYLVGTKIVWVRYDLGLYCKNNCYAGSYNPYCPP